MFPFFEQIFHRILQNFFAPTPAHLDALATVKITVVTEITADGIGLVVELVPHPIYDTDFLVKLAQSVVNDVPVRVVPVTRA